MRTHQQIDERSLALARAIVAKVDADPRQEGLLRAREICAKWFEKNHEPAVAEWRTILQADWQDVRRVLLDEGESGKRLRQSSPFCDVLTPRERWAIYERFSDETTRP